MIIKHINGEREFEKLRADWNTLAICSTNEFDWIYSWWMNNKDNNELQILVAQKDNKILGIAPLYINNSTALKLIPIRKLTFLGGRLSDNIDFFIQEGEQKEIVFKSLLNHIFEYLKFDLAEFNQINSCCPNFSLWQKYAGQYGLNFEYTVESRKIRLSKFNSYEHYFEYLSKNHRKSIRYANNKIKNDNLKLNYVFKKDITKEDIKIVANINLKRQRYLYNKGDLCRSCYFIDENKKNFITDYFCSNSSDKKMLIYMNNNDAPIAYSLSILSKDTWSYWNGTFDPDYEKYAPKKMLTNEIIKHAFEKQYKIFDFMEGNEPYKADWTNESSQIYNLTTNKSLKAKLVFLSRKFLPESLLTKPYSADARFIADENYKIDL
ncbi:MAG: cellulose biosynthesis protein CelD [uncultured bacterium]|nr:MAG: cellulose biosynthesis protein CelD [uncultured bacterium]HBH18127.1 hypothetical protein [Cyanobacteria bacterium UBA9579]